MTREQLGDALALLNAVLNFTSAVLIVFGRISIAQKSGRRAGSHADIWARPGVARHRAAMLGAVGTSALFLVSYLTRVALTGTHVDPHHGALHVIYLAILGSHMLLAITVVPLVLRAVWLAWKKRFEEHKKIVVLAFPIWLYVSVTGVLVYVILYRVPV